MIDPRTPCIIGVAQRTIHPQEGDAPEPLVLWEEMARAAACDSGGDAVLDAVDRLQLVYSLSWQYDDAPGRLAQRIGLKEGVREMSGLSGTSPQKFVNAAAADILAGRGDVALLVGGEALATKKRLKKAGQKPDWSFRPSEKPGMPFDDPFHPAEIKHQVFQAYLTFALFDVARRANRGLSLDAARREVGEIFAPMSEIAAANPRAWLRQARSAEEIITVTPENRMVATPYAKYMVSIMDIDMASAVIVASHEKADALGVPQDRRVYLRGWCSAKDSPYPAEREELWHSVGMEEASREALACAGVGIDDIAHLDLYSCFGSSVSFARDALGIDSSDPRSLTVTGGLPFHGGPGNNYMTHSIATMAERLREDAGALGMVSGVGMHMTNHTFGVYSTDAGALTPPDEAGVQKRTDEAPTLPIEGTAIGPATIASYSVVHGRDGAAWGLAICDLPSGARCYANVRDAALMLAMQEGEWVGCEVELVDGGGGVNLVAG